MGDDVALETMFVTAAQTAVGQGRIQEFVRISVSLLGLSFPSLPESGRELEPVTDALRKWERGEADWDSVVKACLTAEVRQRRLWSEGRHSVALVFRALGHLRQLPVFCHRTGELRQIAPDHAYTFVSTLRQAWLMGGSANVHLPRLALTILLTSTSTGAQRPTVPPTAA